MQTQTQTDGVHGSQECQTDLRRWSAYFHLLLRDNLPVLHFIAYCFANALTNANVRWMGYMAPKCREGLGLRAILCNDCQKAWMKKWQEVTKNSFI